MKNFLKRLLLFSTPVFLCFVFIFLIDPYEYINVFHFISSDTKFEVLRRSDESMPRGHMLWKTIHFDRKPSKNIIIGDSQGAGFKEAYISQLTGKDYFNYCVTGASYTTMFKIFWHAAETTQLKHVYFQVGFMNYNANRSYDIYHYAEDYLEKPYYYFTSKNILIDSFYNFLYYLTKNENLINKSYEHLNIDVQDERSEELLQLFFGNYKYPKEYYKELKKISQYCKAHNIQLNFIIFPMYDKVREYLAKNGLNPEYKRFKSDIESLGKTYDFDKASSFTKNRKNFIDYFHPIPEAYADISQNIWAK